MKRAKLITRQKATQMAQIHPSYTKAFKEYENTLEDIERRREALNEYEDATIVAYEKLLDMNNKAIENEN